MMSLLDIEKSNKTGGVLIQGKRACLRKITSTDENEAVIMKLPTLCCRASQTESSRHYKNRFARFTRVKGPLSFNEGVHLVFRNVEGFVCSVFMNKQWTFETQVHLVFSARNTICLCC